MPLAPSQETRAAAPIRSPEDLTIQIGRDRKAPARP